MKLSDELSHAIKYCEFKLSNVGKRTDQVILTTSNYLATGEPFIQSVLIFHTLLNHPVLEPYPELYGLDEDSFGSFNDAVNKVNSSRFLLENESRPYLYKLVQNKLRSEFKSDSYYVQYPDLIMNLSYFLTHKDTAQVKRLESLIPTIPLNNIIGDWGYYNYKSIFAVNYS